MATRVEDLDRSISYALQPLRCAVRAPKPEQRMSLKSIYKGRTFSTVFVDLRPTLRPNRSLILDIKLCFTDEGLNSNVAWIGTWQTLLPDTNGKLNGMLVKL